MDTVQERRVFRKETLAEEEGNRKESLPWMFKDENTEGESSARGGGIEPESCGACVCMILFSVMFL